MFDYFDNKLILGKDFSVSDFLMLHEKMASKKLDFIVVSKSHATDDQFMANVYFMFPKTPILVSKTHFEMDDSVFLSQKEMQNFSRIVNSAAMHRCKMNLVDLDSDFEVYSPTSVVASSLKFESIIQKINKAKVMGSSLSQFEKYLYAYQQVTGFGVDLKCEKQSLFHGMETKKLNEHNSVELLFELCKKLGIPCMYQDMYVPKAPADDGVGAEQGYGKTAVCMVYLKDASYDIDGLYVAYPSFDMGSFDSVQTIHHSLLTYKDFVSILGYEFYLKLNKLDLQTINRMLEKMAQTENVACKTPTKEQVELILKDMMAVVCLDITPFLLDLKDINDKRLVEKLAKRAEELLNVKQIPRIVDESTFATFVAEEYDSTENYLKRFIRGEIVNLADDENFIKKMADLFYSGYSIDAESLAKHVLAERNGFEVPQDMVDENLALIENAVLLKDFKMFQGLQKQATTIELNDYLSALTNIEQSKGADVEQATQKAMEIIARSEQLAKLLWRENNNQNPFMEEIVHAFAPQSKIMN